MKTSKLNVKLLYLLACKHGLDCYQVDVTPGVTSELELLSLTHHDTCAHSCVPFDFWNQQGSVIVFRCTIWWQLDHYDPAL